jgi:hypothetical protein
MNVRKTLLAVCIATGSIATLSATPASADVYVRVGPPAPRHEVVPVVQPGWVWQPGYWNWNGHRYVWVRGHRIRAHRGAHWAPHHWVEDGGRWRMERGRWERD